LSILALASLGNGVVLAGTETGGKILCSIDSGATWADLGQQFSETRIYALASLGNGVVLAGTGLGGKILRSTDLSTPLAVKTGRYQASAAQTHPVLYVCPLVSSGIAELAGNVSRESRITFLVTGGCTGTDRDATWTDAQNLAANVENVLMWYGADSGYWAGGHFGIGYGDDSNPEGFGQFTQDAVQDAIAIHFAIRWSVDCRIAREALT